MAREQIGSFDGLPIFRQHLVEEDLIQLMEGTTWGTDTTHYQHFHARHHLAQVAKPHIFSIRDDKEILGAVVLCERTLFGTYKAYYLRYFAASPRIKGKGFIARVSPMVMDFIKAEEKEPAIFYASTVYDNQRMYHFARELLGFEELGASYAFSISRFRPKKKGRVTQLSPEEINQFLPQLNRSYQSYAFWITDHIGIDGQYHALWENGEIIAAAQVHHGFWRVKKMPGWIGKIVLPILPYTPLHKIFDPNAFNFIALEGIYLKSGFEHRLQDLAETLMLEYNRNAALFWMADRDPWLNTLPKVNRMGILQSFMGAAKSRFWGYFHKVPEAEKIRFRQAPIYISCLDYL